MKIKAALHVGFAFGDGDNQKKLITSKNRKASMTRMQLIKIFTTR